MNYKNSTGENVKIRDVAKLAGVSPSTVSYVLSGKRSVSEAVKRNVLEKIEILGYKPNAVARDLASGKTNTIGLYCAKSSKENDLFFLKMLNGIIDSVVTSGYKLLIINDIEGDDNFSLPIDSSFPIDGAVITNTRSSQMFLAELQKENIPCVLIGKPPKDTNMSYVDNDNVRACYKSVEYLLEKNIRRIGLVISPLSSATINLDATAGYILAHSDYHIPYDERFIFPVDENDQQSVEQLFTLLEDLQIEGVVITSLFVPVINRLIVRSPREIVPVIFGYDILSNYNLCMRNEIAYMESNAYKLGFDAASLVAKFISGKKVKTEQKLYAASIKKWIP